jgi:hypothetical protein
VPSIAAVRDAPGWIIGTVVALMGLWFLTWHAYARDEEDDAWLDPGQPPVALAMPLAPAAHGGGTPMSCNDAFRSRCYPDTLQVCLQALVGG